MKYFLFLLSIVLSGHLLHAQKIDSIQFNLYTDSLVKGFHNYINVDGKTTDGKWLPLTERTIILTSNSGDFEGNEILIDSSYAADSIVVRAVLRANPAVWKETVIYIRKRGFDLPLKTEEEILSEMKSRSRRN